jgi:hypothetical protein
MPVVRLAACADGLPDGGSWRADVNVNIRDLMASVVKVDGFVCSCHLIGTA